MNDDLESKSLKELQEIAKAVGVKYILKYRKKELIAHLKEIGKTQSISIEDPDFVPVKRKRGRPKKGEAQETLVSTKSSESRESDPASMVGQKEEVNEPLPAKNDQDWKDHRTKADETKNRKTKVDETKDSASNDHEANEIVSTTRDSKEEGNFKAKDSTFTEDKPLEERTSRGINLPTFVDHNGFELKEKITPKETEEPKVQDSLESVESLEEGVRDGEKIFPPDTINVSGILEIQDQNNFGFLRSNNFQSTPEDIYVSPIQIRRFHLKSGDEVAGKTRPQRESDKFRALFYVDTVNGDNPGRAINRREFERLVPIFPDVRLHLEVPESNDLTTRIIDLISPVGKGQRGLIVAPPKAGKTTILKKLAKSVAKNHPEVHLMVLLIDERPEEVTDMREVVASISNGKGEVTYSTFDEDPMNHIKVSEMVLERAKRLVEHGRDVVILMDSITRLARASNLTVTPSGRTLSGGLDPAALLMPKRFFGAARNIRGGGSLTILATALVDTGSRMDDMIFEEFKGTGNMELHLDRRLQERRIFPAIDLQKSGTRRDDLLLSKEELEGVKQLHSLWFQGDNQKVTLDLLSIMDKCDNNEDFLETVKRLKVKDSSKSNENHN